MHRDNYEFKITSIFLHTGDINDSYTWGSSTSNRTPSCPIQLKEGNKVICSTFKHSRFVMVAKSLSYMCNRVITHLM